MREKVEELKKQIKLMLAFAKKKTFRCSLCGKEGESKMNTCHFNDVEPRSCKAESPSRVLYQQKKLVAFRIK